MWSQEGAAIERRGVSRRAVLAALAASGAAQSACSGPRGTAASGGSGHVVRHRFGSTRVPAEPDRVVALGVGDTEAAVALGVVPVAGTDVLGLDDLTRPWVAASFDGRRAPALLDWRSPPFEEIVGLRPDVILYVNAPGDRQVFDTLSKIAPTVAAPAGSTRSFDVGWREHLRTIASALDRTAAADRVVADVDARVSAARAGHPELAGLTAIGGLSRGDQLYFWPERDPRSRLLVELGLRSSPALAELDDTGYLLSVSPERYDLLECDVLYLSVLGPDGAVPDALATGALRGVEAAGRGPVALAPGPSCYGSATAAGDYAGALALGGALGIPACLDQLLADLTAALRR